MARIQKTEDQPATTPVGAPREVAVDAATRNPRPGSKLAKVVELLEGECGASIAEIMTATSWQLPSRRHGREAATDDGGLGRFRVWECPGR